MTSAAGSATWSPVPMPNNESKETWPEGDALTWQMVELVLLPLVMLIGVVGNCVVLYIYNCRLQSTTSSMIKRMLAMIDLSACTVVNSLIMYLLLNKNSGIYQETCVFVSCFAVWTLNSGSCVLVVIAVDRFMRICLMRLTGVSTSLLQKLFAAFLLMSGLINIPCFWIFGKSTRYYPKYQIKISHCFFRIERLTSTLFRVYYAYTATFYVACFLVLFFLYFKTTQTLYRHSNNRKVLFIPQSGDTSLSNLGTQQFDARSNIVMFVVVTTIYSVTNGVYIILVSIYFFDSEIQADMNPSFRAVYEVAKYGPMFTHIINPFIYSFVLPTFRKEVYHLIRKMFW
ncbi:hypothetical protein BsWGS_22269 [Bradybaena similaris]